MPLRSGAGRKSSGPSATPGLPLRAQRVSRTRVCDGYGAGPLAQARLLPVDPFPPCLCELAVNSFSWLICSLSPVQAEETEFQQAGDGDPERIFLFPSQQPVPQRGSQRGAGQEVRHHRVPGEARPAASSS